MALECCCSTPICLCVIIFLLYLTKKYFSGGVCKSNNRIDGKTVIITGGNTGIGKETALDLAKRGGRVILACRDMKKGQEAAKDVIQESGNTNVYLKKLDLASLASVRAFAEEILKTESRLDILINNAGVMMCPYWKTEDGFEMQLGVNHLGHFLLTNLLLDLMKKSAPSRVINVSSIGHRMVSKIHFDDINSEKSYYRMREYSQSKLANVLFTRELAHQLEGTNVTAYSLHPGCVNTELARHSFDYLWIFKLLWTPMYFFFFKTPKQGAQTSIHLAVSDDVEKFNGMYFADCGIATTSRVAMDDGMAKKLWDVSVNMVGL